MLFIYLIYAMALFLHLSLAKVIIVENDTTPAPIQTGIDNAEIGDTVYIKNGIYKSESINIEKGIVIKGENKDSVIIDLNDNYFCIRIYNVLAGVELSHLTIANSKYAGISLLLSKTIISDVIITGCYRGIDCAPDNYRTGDTILIKNSTLTGNEIGLELNYDGHNIEPYLLDDVFINNCIINGNNNGIRFFLDKPIGTTELDLTDNYWGITDSKEIGLRIRNNCMNEIVSIDFESWKSDSTMSDTITMGIHENILLDDVFIMCGTGIDDDKSLYRSFPLNNFFDSVYDIKGKLVKLKSYGISRGIYIKINKTCQPEKIYLE